MDIQNLLCPLDITSATTCLQDDDNKQQHAYPETPVSQYHPNSWMSQSPPPPLSPPSSLSSVSSPPTSPSMVSTTTSPRLSKRQQHRNGGSQTRTPWTWEEDYLLQHGYSQGLSWAAISSTYLPHRSRGCCWGRFKTLQAKALEQREWTEAEDQLLMIAIKKHAHLFKQAWKAVSHELPNRSWRECEFRATKVTTTSPIRKRQPNLLS